MLAIRLLLPAYLITALSLVYAAPATKDHAKNSKNSKNPGVSEFTITFVNQNNPNKSPGATHAVTPPHIIEQFFKNSETLQALGYKQLSPEWVWLAQDDSYSHSIAMKSPVYVQVEGGPEAFGKCSKRVKNKCLALVDVSGESPKYALMTRADRTLVYEVGNPAIVYFSNRQASSVDNPPEAHILATEMVDSFFRNKEIQTKLGFSGMPNIVHMDIFPSHGGDSVVHFEFAGGSQCPLQMHCYAYVKFNHLAEPEYEGAVFRYDYLQSRSGTSMPFVTYKEKIKGTKELVQAKGQTVTH